MFLQTKNSKKIIVAAAILVLAVNFGYTNNAHGKVCAFDIECGTGFRCELGTVYGTCVAKSTDGPATPGQSTASAVGEIPIIGGAITAGVYVFGAVGLVVQELANLFALLAGGVYDLAIQKNLNFGQSLDVITIGWKLSRDLANMFFILILLFIAITTMLRVSGYETKVLLRKLIVIALLINFSLAGGLMIIDGTNVLGNEFYSRITNNGTASVSTKILEGSRVQTLFKIKSTASVPGLGKIAWDFAVGSPDQLPSAINFAKLVWGTVIIVSIFTYVILFAAIFLIIRFAVLAILLVLMPLAFLGAILPKTENMWNEWWSKFLNHAFFFPAHMFMVMFAVLFMDGFVKASFPNGQITDANLLQDPSLLLGFLIAGVMLVGSLIVARTLSVFGSGTVLKWASAGGKAVQGAMVGGAINQTIGRAGQAIQTAAPNSYLANRVGGTMADYGGKFSPLGGRAKQQKDKAEFQMASTLKKSTHEQLKDLRESKNMKFKEDYVVGNLMKDEAKLAKIWNDPATTAGDKALIRNIVSTKMGVEGIKKLDKTMNRSALSKAQAGTATTPAQKTSDYMDGVAAAEQEGVWKAMTNQERADTVSDWQDDPTKINRTQDWLNHMEPEEKLKTTEAIGKGLTRNTDKLSSGLANLTEDLKRSAGANLTEREAQQMADKSTDKDAFYKFVDKYAPNRKESVNVVLPDVALRNAGDASKIVPALNMRAVPAAQITPQVLQNVIKHGSAQQIRDLAARQDTLPALKAHLAPLYKAADGDIAKLAKAMETENRALASWITSHQNEAKTLFDLT